MSKEKFPTLGSASVAIATATVLLEIARAIVCIVADANGVSCNFLHSVCKEAGIEVNTYSSIVSSLIKDKILRVDGEMLVINNQAAAYIILQKALTSPNLTTSMLSTRECIGCGKEHGKCSPPCTCTCAQ